MVRLASFDEMMQIQMIISAADDLLYAPFSLVVSHRFNGVLILHANNPLDRRSWGCANRLTVCSKVVVSGAETPLY